MKKPIKNQTNKMSNRNVFDIFAFNLDALKYWIEEKKSKTDWIEFGWKFGQNYANVEMNGCAIDCVYDLNVLYYKSNFQSN